MHKVMQRDRAKWMISASSPEELNPFSPFVPLTKKEMIRMHMKPISDPVTVTLYDGTVITGQPDRVVEVAKAMGTVLPCYQSETKGPIPVCTMNTMHLRNALLKQITEWTTTLRSLSNKELQQELYRVAPSTPLVAHLRNEFMQRDFESVRPQGEICHV